MSNTKKIVFSFIYYDSVEFLYYSDKIEFSNIDCLDLPVYELINMIGDKIGIENPDFFCWFRGVKSLKRMFTLFDPKITIRNFINQCDSHYKIENDKFINKKTKEEKSNVIKLSILSTSHICYHAAPFIKKGEPNEYNCRGNIKPAKDK